MLKKAGWWLVIFMVGLMLTLPRATLAQTTPDSGPPAPEPSWFKSLPAYTGLENLTIDDNTLAGLNIRRADNYFQVGLTGDSVTTVADFYKTKLAAAGWELKQQNNLMGAQLLTLANAKETNAQLQVIVAGKDTIKLLPQLKTLDDRVPAGKTILALVAPTKPRAINPPANTPAAQPTTGANTTAKGGVTPPAWLKDIPQYPVQTVKVEDKALAALGVDPTQNYVQAGTTADSVKTVSDFYVSKLTAQGWPAPQKRSLGSAELGQLLDFQDGKLTILITTKLALGLLPGDDAKKLADQIPDGQTIVALITQADVGPQGGIACQPGQECQVGPYKVRMTFDRSSFNTTDTFPVTIERVDGGAGDWTLKAAAVPSRSTSATEVDFQGSFERGSDTKRQVTMNFPIAGNWYVYLTINPGTTTEAKLYIPQKADPPPHIPDWLAWVIGLCPLIGIAGFAFGQWRLVRRRQRTEQQTSLTEQPELESVGPRA